MDKALAAQLAAIDVSVPFRGSCSEIVPFAYMVLSGKGGFRPLSGFVF